ncbi:MAG TPA: hypothetical protein VFG86_06485 [Chloroflexota bacterium]|jgi:hypothetical protein|nr:hypothetical protein [Chloroflexota bacterium]
MLNRGQVLVLSFFVLAWASLIVILAVAPEIYGQTLRVTPGDIRIAEFAFLVGLTALIAVLCLGVVRRWRWTFWLILVAFLAGVLRVPASILELLGILPTAGPTWYVLLQATLGLAQFGIALVMLAEYRRARRPWGAR